MAKYDFDFKLRIVRDYLAGKASTRTLSHQYGLPNHAQLERWVRRYQTHGEEGLKRSRKRQQYSFEFKLQVVELYLTTEMSYQELAIRVGMKNPTTISQWVSNYRAAGVESLKEKPKGRRREVDKKKLSKEQPKELPDEKAEYLKQLEEENRRLRIENAFLKELRRLRLEEEAQRTQRELQAVSEENSD